MEISKIVEGWSNSLLDQLNLLDTNTKEIALKRIDICNTCENYKQIYKLGIAYKGCSICGCKIPQKCFSIKSKCPINKW